MIRFNPFPLDIRRMDGKTERPTDLHLLQEQGNHRTPDSETPIGDECSSTGSFQSNSSGKFEAQ